MNPVTPKASAAMITYNHRPYFEKALSSILAQKTDFPFEVVIGEDKSPDGTGELVRELAAKNPDRVRVIQSEKNVGMHANLERVERACRGDFIAYCEGDDFWQDPHKLAKQVAVFERDPGYALIHSHCDRHHVQTGKTKVNDLRVPENVDDVHAYEEILTGRRYVLTVTVMARRQFVHQILDQCPECTDPKLPMGDTQRWLELSRLGKVGCIHESLATTCLLPESAAQSRDPNKRLKFFLTARDLKLHYLRKYPVAPEIDRAVRMKMALSLLRYSYIALNASVADQMFKEYTQLKGSFSSRANWLRWGSRSRLRQSMVAPLERLSGKLGLQQQLS